MEIRFHNPYRHAMLGLLTEIVAFALFLVFAAIVVLVAAWIA